MKKKLLVLVAMLLCIVTVLSACGETVKFKKIVADEYVDQNPTLTKAEAVTLTGDCLDQAEDLLYFAGLNDDGKAVTTVYNMAENKKVFEATATDTKSYSVELRYGYYDDVAWFVVTVTEDGEEEDTITKEIYDQKGNKVTSFDTEDASMSGVADLIIVDTKAYRIAEDGTIAEAFEVSPLRELPDVSAMNNGYYYDVEFIVPEENSGDMMPEYISIAIYDDELNAICYYELPEYAYEGAFFALNNGNVLVQYKVYEPWTAEEYTYLDDEGSKITLVSKLITAKNGKIKDLDLDFVVLVADSRNNSGWFDYDELNEKIENVALVSYIEDGRVLGVDCVNDVSDEDELFMNTSIISLSNKGKDKGILDGTVVAQAWLPELVAENRWVIETFTGEEYLVDEKGKIVAEIGNASIRGGYLIADGKLFNMDGEMVYDYEAADLERYNNYATARGIFFEDEDGVITLFANGESKTIVAKDADREVIAVIDNYFIVEDNTGDDTKYEIYNDVGTLLYAVEKASGYANAYYASNNVIVLTGLESDDKDVVIRLSVA
ncbi:MAG: hypothetical protein IJA78_05140 [Clostridia bacterium]|nr:hypothetical protein [Clostridia bacterium]